MTRREQIIQAFGSVLSGLAGITGGVYRSRVDAFTHAESPAVLYLPVSDLPDETSLPRITWSLTIRTSVLVRSDSPDSDADSVLAALHAAIFADQGLAGLAIGIEPAAVNFQVLDADKTACIVSVDYAILYQTALADLTTA